MYIWMKRKDIYYTEHKGHETNMNQPMKIQALYYTGQNNWGK